MTQANDRSTGRGRLPPWLTRRLSDSAAVDEVAGMLADLGLATVCDEAHCPNRVQCYAGGTAAFMILGNRCTRACRFCAVEGGRPSPAGADEPDALAEACRRLGLRHVVITSVTRDDLPDGGAGHFADTIRAVRRRLPKAVIEVLTPDFLGRREAIETVVSARPDVFNHNVETVPRLYAAIRPEADYLRSLDVLRYASALAAEAGARLYTKSGLMLGLGETDDEVRGVLGDLRGVGCDMVTIGQYLAPSPAHAPVARYVEPAAFDAWGQEARQMGFGAVAAGPFVRSSYHAEQLFRQRDA